MMLLPARAVGARAHTATRRTAPLHPRLFGRTVNLTLAEPPPPTPPPRKNWDLDGDTLNVWVEADFFVDEGATNGVCALPAAVFGEPFRRDIVHDCVKWQRNNRRQIHRASKRRGDVRGSTRKLYKQKGTGRARVGSARAPIRRGGGKAHGPTRRDFATSFNRRQRTMALRVVLSQKLREGRLTVVPSLDVEPRTRVVAAALRKRDMASAMFVDDVIEEGQRRAVANAPPRPAPDRRACDPRRDHPCRPRARFSLAGGWWGASPPLRAARVSALAASGHPDCTGLSLVPLATCPVLRHQSTDNYTAKSPARIDLTLPRRFRRTEKFLQNQRRGTPARALAAPQILRSKTHEQRSYTPFGGTVAPGCQAAVLRTVGGRRDAGAATHPSDARRPRFMPKSTDYHTPRRPAGRRAAMTGA